MNGWRKFIERTREPLSVYTGEEGGVRHATWLELFFDLVFVVALAELGGYLHEHLTFVGLLHFAGLFAVVWWIWLSVSYFADTYSTDDFVSRLMVITAMFGVIFLSQTISGALGDSSFTFAAAVLVLRLFHTVSHLRARHLRSETSETNAFLTTWIGLEVLVTLVWGLSLLVPEPQRYGLWIASFVLGTVGLTVIYLTFESIIAPRTSHCSERLGLFTILVLGETILAVAVGTQFVNYGVQTLVIGGIGFFIAVAMWWLYFEHYDERVVTRTMLARTQSWTQRRPRGIAHVYSHYLIHAGIVAAGVGIAAVIEASLSHHALSAGGRIALCIGIATFLLGSGISHWMAPTSIDGRIVGVRISIVGLLGLVAFLGGEFSPFALISLVALFLLGLMVFGWYFPLTEPEEMPSATIKA